MRREARAWAQEELGAVELGDRRRTLRLLNMAARAQERPAGKISEVVKTDRERQGAYDLLESGKVSVEAVVCALGNAAGTRAAAESFAYVAIDGASVTLTDRAQNKGFGPVGKYGTARGLNVVNALGLNPHGIPLGLFTQVWWARPPAPIRKGSKKARRAQKAKFKKQRPASEKETRYWLQAIDEAAGHAKQTGASLWFQLDREADCRAILEKLTDSDHQFTVRGTWNRVIEDADSDSQRLLQHLGQKAAQGAYEIDVPAGPQRTARRARLDVRWECVTFRMQKQLLELNVAWATEHRTCPRGEKPLDWLLLTSADVRSLDEARDVIFGYTLRWRIETFHKTWKTGACKVEETQLRSQQAAIVWATLLAAVAARIERLKLLSRTEPEKPASVEFDPYEIRALILLKQEYKKKTEIIPDTMPTIALATRWIADLGGYTGRSSGGPPGSITIRRGLEYLAPAAEILRRLEK